MVLAIFLGIAVAILAVVAVVLVKTADDARDEASIAAGTTDHSAHADSNVSLPLQSFAGQDGRERRGARDGAPGDRRHAAGGARR